MLRQTRLSQEAPMDRRTEEARYVLHHLWRTRRVVMAHPEWFQPDSLERIDRAIVSLRKFWPRAQAA